MFAAKFRHNKIVVFTSFSGIARVSPGAVEALAEHPADPDQVEASPQCHGALCFLIRKAVFMTLFIFFSCLLAIAKALWFFGIFAKSAQFIPSGQHRYIFSAFFSSACLKFLTLLEKSAISITLSVDVFN